MPYLIDLTKNICDTCTMDGSYCPADSEDIEYGTATEGDNIVSCPYYEANPNIPGSSEVVQDIAKAHA